MGVLYCLGGSLPFQQQLASLICAAHLYFLAAVSTAVLIPFDCCCMLVSKLFEFRFRLLAGVINELLFGIELVDE